MARIKAPTALIGATYDEPPVSLGALAAVSGIPTAAKPALSVAYTPGAQPAVAGLPQAGTTTASLNTAFAAAATAAGRPAAGTTTASQESPVGPLPNLQISYTRMFLAEIEAYRPGGAGGGPAGENRAWGTQAWGLRTLPLGALEATEMIRVSDVGYRTGSADTPPLTPYKPLLADSFAVDRTVALSPAQAAAGAAWGALRLLNANRVLDAYLTANSDSRPIRILTGRRLWDPARGYETDPPYSTLTEVFSGVATPWSYTESTLNIPMRDATYWIERPYQENLYAGTGGLEGAAELKGRPKPRTRGGTSIAPVQNVTPILVDALNRIYQYTDGPGTVVALYEGGDAQIPYVGDVTDLYSGSVALGSYRTDNSRGLIQLGSRAFRAITCDVTGAFQSAGAKSTAMDIVKYMLLEDMQVPAQFVDSALLEYLGLTQPATTGWYWSGDDRVDGATAIGPFFTSIAGKMVPLRDGRLSCMLMRKPVDGNASVRITSAKIVSMRPVALSAPLDPPAATWRVGWGRNHTIQTSELDPDVTEDRQQAIGQEWRVESWTSEDVIAAYRRPSQPDIVSTALTASSDALATAQLIGALWGQQRRLYDMEVLLEDAFEREIGEVIIVEYPMDDLDAGKAALVVGDSIRATETTARLRILV